MSVSIRAKALHRASEIEAHLNNSARAQSLAEESLALARTLNDKWNIAWALAALGMCGMFSVMNPTLTEQALVLFRELDDAWGISHSLRRLALIYERQGNSQRAVVLAGEA